MINEIINTFKVVLSTNCFVILMKNCIVFLYNGCLEYYQHLYKFESFKSIMKIETYQKYLTHWSNYQLRLKESHM